MSRNVKSRVIVVALISVCSLAGSLTAQPYSLYQLPFIENTGQYEETVRFYARTLSGMAFVTAEGRITYALPGRDAGGRGAAIGLQERLIGATVASVKGVEPAACQVSYFRGSDPNKWRTGMSSFEALDFGEIYPGVRLELRACGKNIEKLFHVSPRGDVSAIELAVEGADDLRITSAGELDMVTSLGSVTFTRPVAYQEHPAGRRYVEVAYTLTDSGYAFSVGGYDATLPLTIDPLLASTYLGGSGAEGGGGNASWMDIAVADNGDVIVAGMTASTDFPTTVGSFEGGYGGGPSDIFVARLDADLTTVLACAYLGGSGDEHPYSNGFLAIATDGSIYVSGTTSSTNFPTTPGAYWRSRRGGSDVFVSHLSADLTTLLGSTYLGGDGWEARGTIALDASGNVFVAGTTNYLFPTTTGAYDRLYGGNGDFFVSKLSGDLTSLLASTYLGGSYIEDYVTIEVDASGNVYVAGGTGSDDYPHTAGAYDEIHGVPSGNDWTYMDCGITKLDNNLTSVIASTFVGGDGYEATLNMALGQDGSVIIAGHTLDPDYPVTPGAFDETFSGDEYYISRLDADLTTLVASTFNTPGDIGLYSIWGMAASPDGGISVVGAAYGNDLPVTPFAYDVNLNGPRDGFVQKYTADLSALEYSSYLGGSSDDGVAAVCFDAEGLAILIGYSTSTDFPTSPGAYDDYFGPGDGENDAFVAKMTFDPFTRITEGPHVNDGGHSWSANWVDYDNDGYLDLFVSNLDIDNGLYHNNADGTFTKITGEEITANSGGIGSAGVSWADYNNDGYPDAFIATFREGNPPVNTAFTNNGDGSFTPITGNVIVGSTSMSIDPSWADYDNDGLLDLYVTNHHDVAAGTDGNNFMYHQDDTGFIRITEGPTVTNSAGSNSACWADYNGDGYQDLFVANGWVNPNDCLYENNGDGSFSKISSGSPTANSGVSWGGSWGDFDNDGYVDLFVTQSVWNSPGMSYDSLYRNNGDGTFTPPPGIAPNVNGSYSCGAAWGDYDNDGDLDLFVAVDGQNLLYENSGDGSFVRITEGEIVTDNTSSNGCASGDYDRDGDLDLFVTNVQQNNCLYRNNGNANHWINIKCVGVTSNRSAIGTKVRIKAVISDGPVWQMREVSSKTGKNCQNSMNAHFGLGDATVIDSLKLEWPSGIVQVMENVPVDQFLTVQERCCQGRVGDANGEGEYPDEITLGDIMLLVDVKFISSDCSKLPCLAEADVNQDGGANPNCEEHVTLGDIMTLVDFLFITGPETATLNDCL